VNLAGPFFALLTAGAWGATDFVAGVASRKSGVLITLLLMQVIGGLLSLALLIVTAETYPGLAGIAWAAASGISGTIGLGFLLLALSRGMMGLVAPLAALVAASVPAVVGVVNGDRIGPVLAAGLLLALSAIVVISLPDRRLGTPLLRSVQAARPTEWLLILTSGLGSAGFFLCIDQAYDAGAGTAWTLVSVRLTGIAALAVAIAVISARHGGPVFRMPRTVLTLVLLSSLGDNGGLLCYVIANSVGTLSSTVVLASLAPVSTTLLARVLLHERLSRLRLAGVGLAMVGVVLISLGALGV
jgi:drug/metabolite transporter (DMT)-like permease